MEFNIQAQVDYLLLFSSENPENQSSYQENNFAQQEHQSNHNVEMNLVQQDLQIEEDFIDVDRIQNLHEFKVFIDELICPICSQILQEPRICQECSQAFCKQCLSKWFAEQIKSCPCCRSYSYQNIDGCQAPKLLFKLLSKLKLSCKYEKCGCKEVIFYDNRQKHYKTQCEYNFINCQYCLQKIRYIDSKAHFDVCEFKPVKCEWCKQQTFYYNYQTHLLQCSFRKFQCSECQKVFPYSQINIHTPHQCQNLLQKKQKIKYLQNKSEIEKTKKELLGQMKKIKKLERLFRKQKQQIQEKEFSTSIVSDDMDYSTFNDKFSIQQFPLQLQLDNFQDEYEYYIEFEDVFYSERSIQNQFNNSSDN